MNAPYPYRLDADGFPIGLNPAQKSSMIARYREMFQNDGNPGQWQKVWQLDYLMGGLLHMKGGLITNPQNNMGVPTMSNFGFTRPPQPHKPRGMNEIPKHIEEMLVEMAWKAGGWTEFGFPTTPTPYDTEAMRFIRNKLRSKVTAAEWSKIGLIVVKVEIEGPDIGLSVGGLLQDDLISTAELDQLLDAGIDICQNCGDEDCSTSTQLRLRKAQREGNSPNFDDASMPSGLVQDNNMPDYVRDALRQMGLQPEDVTVISMDELGGGNRIPDDFMEFMPDDLRRAMWQDSQGSWESLGQSPAHGFTDNSDGHQDPNDYDDDVCIACGGTTHCKLSGLPRNIRPKNNPDPKKQPENVRVTESAKLVQMVMNDPTVTESVTEMLTNVTVRILLNVGSKLLAIVIYVLIAPFVAIYNIARLAWNKVIRPILVALTFVNLPVGIAILAVYQFYSVEPNWTTFGMATGAFGWGVHWLAGFLFGVATGLKNYTVDFPAEAKGRAVRQWMHWKWEKITYTFKELFLSAFSDKDFGETVIEDDTQFWPWYVRASAKTGHWLRHDFIELVKSLIAKAQLMWGGLTNPDIRANVIAHPERYRHFTGLVKLALLGNWLHVYVTSPLVHKAKKGERFWAIVTWPFAFAVGYLRYHTYTGRLEYLSTNDSVRPSVHRGMQARSNWEQSPVDISVIHEGKDSVD